MVRKERLLSLFLFFFCIWFILPALYPTATPVSQPATIFSNEWQTIQRLIESVNQRVPRSGPNVQTLVYRNVSWLARGQRRALRCWTSDVRGGAYTAIGQPPPLPSHLG